MELSIEKRKYYRVKRGQTLGDVADAFCIPPCVLVACNALKGEVYEGQVLEMPQERRNLYFVRGGESKSLLCGSKENFQKRNGTANFYIGQTVWL